ncbi:MAG TPA: helix-turn-helix domain-containing protein [Chloroflexota bacterium]|nr:helix-turn-helix domain-containing protein [Chloroflexota bacterium]
MADNATHTLVQTRGDLARLVRQHRRARGLSQEELAGLIEPPLSVTTIGNVERGHTLPFRHTVEALAAALGLDEGERAELLAAWRDSGGAARNRPARARAITRPVTPSVAAAAAAPRGAGKGGGRPAQRAPRLPAELNSFIGRQGEMAQLTTLLAAEGGPRLVTLTGSAGTGKTRLAVRIAAGLGEAFEGRVAFISLAAVSEPERLLASIAGALGLDDDGPAVAQSLEEQLRAGRWLLVLDNLEQLLEATPLLVDLLAACPTLRLLATSREALRVTGEQVFPVPPLTLPALGQHPPLCEDSESVALFVDRARLVDPAFALDETNTQHVVALCHRLEGIPLAIELAAGRVGILPPAALLEQWDASGGLAVLADGLRDVPARHRTLRAAIAWSHDLLDPEEQVVFRRLGVFEGGFTREAAEAVADGTPEVVGAALVSLAAKSLVQHVGGGAKPRFAMLETLRAFALERLAAASEEERVRGAHAAWLADLAERGENAVYTAERDAWVERMAREYDNARAALRWLVARDEEASIGLAQRLLTSLAQLSVHGLLAECRAWAERLAARDDPPTPIRARFLANTYVFALFQGDLARVWGWVSEAVDVARAAGEPRPLGEALFAAGYAAQLLGRHAEAIPLFAESLTLYRPVEEEEGRRGITLLGLGVSLASEDPGGADALLAEGLELFRRRGSWFGLTLAHNAMGAAAALQGDVAAACAHCLMGLRLSQEHGDRWMAAYVLSSMMPALAELGDVDTALPLLEELLSVTTDLALPFYARSALVRLDRLIPPDAREGPAAALYERYADQLGAGPRG